MKHIKRLNEEIGFDYGKKPQPVPGEVPEKLNDESVSFSLDSVEKSYKKIAKVAFAARKTSSVPFDEWWATVWNTGVPKEEKKSLYPERGKIGFNLGGVNKSAPKPVQSQQVPVQAIDNRPRRIGPPKPPTKPGQKPPTIPSPRPKRRGVWMNPSEIS